MCLSVFFRDTVPTSRQQAPVRAWLTCAGESTARHTAYARPWVQSNYFKQPNWTYSQHTTRYQGRPNPATNQTGFCWSMYESSRLHDRKHGDSTTFSPGRDWYPPSPRMGCCQIPTLWRKVYFWWNETTRELRSPPAATPSPDAAADTLGVCARAHSPRYSVSVFPVSKTLFLEKMLISFKCGFLWHSNVLKLGACV